MSDYLFFSLSFNKKVYILWFFDIINLLTIKVGEKMRKADFIIIGIAVVIMAALGIGYKLYLNSIGDHRVVNIYVNSQLVQTIKLTEETNEDIIIDNEYGYNLVRIRNNGIQVIEADCPNQDDVRAGFVNSPGIPIVCLPHRLTVIIEGGEPLFDDVVG
jgi:hypothetical protein